MEYIKEEQISTKTFVLNIFNFILEIRSYWRFLLIALSFGTIFDLTKNIFDKKDVEYSGSITFQLELEGSAGPNQLSGLANSFGIGGGQAKSGDLLGAPNFPEIIKSVKVFQKALMKEIEINGKKELFINYYIEKSDIKKNEWKQGLFDSPSPFLGYKFKPKRPEDFTPFENTLFDQIYSKLALTTDVTPSEHSSLIQISSRTTNEKLTKDWLETLMETTEEFYKDMKTKKTKQLLVLQERRLDSLGYLLKHNDSRLARVSFDNPNVVDPTGQMKQVQISRDNNYISTQYYTQLTNVETLNRLIYEQTPIFTILEPIRFPLKTISKTGIALRLNGLISLFFCFVILIINRTYLQIMEIKEDVN